MATKHTVEAGDWIGAIAQKHGFAHWAEIWDHAVNDAIRALRGTPDLLMVGDDVHIPGPDDDSGVDVPTGRRVVFVARRQQDLLRLRVSGVAAFVGAFGPLEFELEVGPETVTGTIEGEGQVIEAPLPPAAKDCTLTLGGSLTFTYAIGGLGPVDEAHGAHARVVNLGFDDEPEQAFKTFQRYNALDPNGTPDDATRKAILAQYGA